MKTGVIDPTKADIRRGRKVGEFLHQWQDADSVRYDARKDAIILKMVSGLVVSVPRKLSAELAKLDKRSLRYIGLTMFGEALEIKSKDLHLSVGGLLHRLLGIDHSERGGRARTPAKARAARLNGRKGGRPKKRAA
jgi:hypothetical protein